MLGASALVKDAIPRLVRMLDDEDAYVRCDVARALGFIGRKRADTVRDAIPKLVRLLDDEDAGVRCDAASCQPCLQPSLFGFGQ